MKFFQKQNIPNILSLIRLMMVPLFVWLFFAESIRYNRHWAIFVFILASATDVVDGYLARKNNWVSDFGKIIDPLADKLMQISAFISIAVKTKIGIVLAACICIKDLLMLIGGIVLSKKGARDLVVSKWYGKLNTCVLAVTLGVLILFYEKTTLTYVMSAISVCMMIFTLIMYCSQVYVKYIKSTENKCKTETIDK